MTLALISKEPKELLQSFPGFDRVNVNVPGILQAYDVGVGSDLGDSNYELVEPAAFVIPEGMVISGPPSYEMDDQGVVNEFYPTMPAPAPPPPPVATVTMRQARLALLAAGLLDQIDAAVAAAGPAAKIEWEYAQEIRRDSPLIAQLAVGLNLSSEAIDGLFAAAKSL